MLERKQKWAASAAFALTVAGAYCARSIDAQGPVNRFAGPTSSQPIALTADGAYMAVVNPDRVR